MAIDIAKLSVVYAECHYAECHGACLKEIITTKKYKSKISIKIVCSLKICISHKRLNYVLHNFVKHSGKNELSDENGRHNIQHNVSQHNNI